MDYQKLTYSEFTNWTKSRYNKNIKSSTEAAENWTKTKNLKQAREMAATGWDAGIKELQPEKEINKPGTMHAYNAVAGGRVNVGAYCSGNPMAMVNFQDETVRERPKLSIYCPLTYLDGSQEKTENAMKYAKKVLAVLNNKKKKYNIELIGLFAGRCSGQKYGLEVKIKQFDHETVLNSLAFAFHPSFFRRLFFRWMESKRYIQKGYGQVLTESRQMQAINANNPGGCKKLFLPSFQVHGLNWSESGITEI